MKTIKTIMIFLMCIGLIISAINCVTIDNNVRTILHQILLYINQVETCIYICSICVVLSLQSILVEIKKVNNAKK